MQQITRAHSYMTRTHTSGLLAALVDRGERLVGQVSTYDGAVRGTSLFHSLLVPSLSDNIPGQSVKAKNVPIRPTGADRSAQRGIGVFGWEDEVKRVVSRSVGIERGHAPGYNDSPSLHQGW
jgi:hypothetical protein